MLRGEDRDHRIRTIVARLSQREDASALPADADLYRQMGIASSAALELLLSLEDEFRIQLPDVEFNEARTLTALSALVARVGE
jgi:acyl carrier protein